ncbi:wax ester/triacylglycerol synthase family O-acyltransferase [Mitsuaria sp. GD03876]|uniref:wax ester/triacylglycerol synthase family O-acyltransferase n=1 Tax=Mitsuaria sp. GD03876 TaxID=2975399 RepID=UPI00244D2CA9|nr:wax ester/triacylglycerol synthase family O-acyltransferase [Mitsuaria sp. GD03876]MDH0867979.1 wax ester/triacylglycerol synthase family O-acyltransferase [Mitsuaria sp. GD03876]
MSKVDTAWLRLDTEANRMVIHGVLFLKPGVALDDLRARVAERLLRFPRFRQRVVESGDSAYWVEDAGLDITRHVVAESLSRRRGRSLEGALQDRLAELAAEPLDPGRPLWQLHLIEHYDGASALIARVHHCIADGIALIAVLLSITDGGIVPPDAMDAVSGATPSSGRGVRSKGAKGKEAKGKDGHAAADDAEPEWLADAMVKPINAWTVREIQEHAAQGGNGASPAERLGKQVLQDAAALTDAPDDDKTRLKGKAGRDKRVAWAAPLPLDAVKAVGKSMSVSVNDVLLSCVAGAIGLYLREHGDETRDQEIRALVPVNLRPLETAWQLGNRFGMVPLPLPIGIGNPVKRLYAVHARTQAVKNSLQPALSLGLMATSGSVEKAAQRAMLKTLSRKATALMTNVPGPAQALRLCGASVERVMFWAPQAGDMSLGISILTYAGQVQFGLIADAGLCPDPERIVAHFEPEFQQLLTLALMLPWEAKD